MAKKRRGPIGCIPYLVHFTAIIILTFFGATSAPSQASLEELQNVLRDKAAFTAEDFATLERGEMVVKLLPVSDKREVAVCGLMRLQVPPAVGLRAFQQSLTQRNSSSIREIGKFSNNPSVEDLGTLTLENRDLEDLKQCVVGRCKLKLSAAMIERFRKEVDWAATDYRTRATMLYRQMLLDYVRDYLARGDSALMEYRDQANPVSLIEEHRSLLEESLYINDFAPEFRNYLQSFPTNELKEVENVVNWTKIKFGLKPVTIITHTATYKRQPGGAPQILVLSKQLYANHYFDSSLALTALIKVPTSAKNSDTYLLYTNRSRADSLDGAFSQVKRNLVEGEAVTNLNAILLQTSLNLENMNQPTTPPESRSSKLVTRLFGGTRFIWWLMAIILLIAWFALVKRKQKG